MKPVLLRAAAREDAHAIAAKRREFAGKGSAERFVTAYREALGLIAENPGMGSSRWAHELEIPGLMTWVVCDTGCSLVYIDQGAHLELWRVLDHRQIPWHIRDPDEDTASD